MIFFIAYSLILAILVKTNHEILALLTSPVALGLGLTIMLASMIAGYLKKASTINWHDGFATGGLLVWYAYWQPEFGADAPMFLLYPLYFAAFTSILTLSLINKADYFDVESVVQLRYLEKITRFNMPFVIGFVFLGLLITRHYALYAMAMTFFMVRHTMIVCLEKIDSH